MWGVMCDVYSICVVGIGTTLKVALSCLAQLLCLCASLVIKLLQQWNTSVQKLLPQIIVVCTVFIIAGAARASSLCNDFFRLPTMLSVKSESCELELASLCCSLSSPPLTQCRRAARQRQHSEIMFAVRRRSWSLTWSATAKTRKKRDMESEYINSEQSLQPSISLHW